MPEFVFEAEHDVGQIGEDTGQERRVMVSHRYIMVGEAS